MQNCAEKRETPQWSSWKVFDVPVVVQRLVPGMVQTVLNTVEVPQLFFFF